MGSKKTSWVNECDLTEATKDLSQFPVPILIPKPRHRKTD